MTEKNKNTLDFSDQRRTAEKILKGKEIKPKEPLTLEETQSLLHELYVHQIELELQNEELRHAQLELEQARERYFDLYDLAPIGYCTISAKGLILEGNLTAAELLGVPVSELIKQPFSKFIVEEDQDIFYLHRKKLFDSGKPQDCELRMLKKDDGKFWVHLDTTIAETDTGRTCHIVFTDISEQKTVEAARLDAEVQFHLLFEQSPDGIVIIDPATGRILEFNATAHEQLGYSREEFSKLKISDLDVVETPEEIKSRITRVMHEGRNDFETRHRTRQGEIRNVHVTAQFTEMQGKKVYHCVWRDITERKQAENLARLAREVFEVLNQPESAKGTVKDILHIIKESTGLEAVAIRLREGDDFPYYHTNGFSEEFLAAENYLCERDNDGELVLDSEGDPLLGCMCGNVLRGRTNPSFPFFTKYGSFWSNCTTELLASTTEKDRQSRTRNRCNIEGYESVALIPLHSGENIIGLLQLNDHRENQFTLEMIRFFEGLSPSIGIAFTRRLAEEQHEKLENQLRQSQKMEAVGLLAGGVAHDFNNMLSVINGYSEMLMLEFDPADIKYKRLMEIHNAGLRSAELTQQLLAFARKQTIAPKVLDLNDTISGMLKMLQRLIGENIKLVWEPVAKIWKIKMDPSQINQIMANLLVNARDAISDIGTIVFETGHAEIDEEFCRTHPDASPGEYVVVSVSDNGSGMDKDTLGHIFEPFYTTKGVGEGTGLGLSTVFGIVKQNHGFIDVSSEPGKGTLFKIYLPFYASDDTEKDEKSAPEIFTGTETVLLVEDDKVVLDFTRELLEQLGYTVLASIHAKNAVKIAEEFKNDIHLLLTDLIMPEMNGRILRDKIISVRPDIKCLFMSGYTADIISKSGVLDENIYFLEKPFTIENLSVKLHEILSQK